MGKIFRQTKNIVKLLSVLRQLRWHTPQKLYWLCACVATHGLNLLALIHFMAKIRPTHQAITDTKRSVNFRVLYDESLNVALILAEKYHLAPRHKVAVLCGNHLSFIQILLALGRLGCDVCLLNTDMTAEQLQTICQDQQFDLLMTETAMSERIQAITQTPKYLMDNFLQEKNTTLDKVPRHQNGRLILLTGGTTGKPKLARRKPSLLNLISPLDALINQIGIAQYESVYVAVPIFHGYGLAAVIVALLLGKHVLLTEHYDTAKAADLLQSHGVQVAVVVPIMLQRLFLQKPESLYALGCIISGGATISESLAEKILQNYGDILYNLYGTSEAGFSVLAQPSDLQKFPRTIGKPIGGVQVRITDLANKVLEINQIGELMLCNAWSAEQTQQSNWISTGDLAYQNTEGYIFLVGRKDNMIVSGGENVYPEDVEQILSRHEAIESVCVVGIPDTDFGQRLKALVLLREGQTLSAEQISQWLAGKVARYQMPAQIVLVRELPFTTIGKMNRKTILSCRLTQ